MSEVQHLDGDVAADKGQGQERHQAIRPARLRHRYAPTRKSRRRVEIGDGPHVRTQHLLRFKSGSTVTPHGKEEVTGEASKPARRCKKLFTVQRNIADMTIENEHRFSVRRPRRHGAWITFDDDIRSFECQVLDISAGGAKLATNVEAPIGGTFRLSAAPHSLVRRCCEIVWRDGRQLGVKFTDTPSPGATLLGGEHEKAEHGHR
jgi:PilZ domain